MVFLHTNSCDSLKSELSLLDLPPPPTVIKSSHWVQYKTISSLTDQAPIEFTIPGNCEYLDLAETMLSLRVNITPKKPLEKGASEPVFGPVVLSKVPAYTGRGKKRNPEQWPAWSVDR
ncbi:hypothetical protein TSAR_005202 [Trichomalopsis sarcophagae]|uniref:Uncharacterized protein n=1 Tax=Trichomalopsis sarcophagae TaxID=543379 RepID=A0A232EFL7_9HYME|nr:hypothetical protein TSAR_005202 [Trichomalopsis sarcophagae]